ncbi:hypothetical protein CHS0354_002964 [Potamilus streckersoni]|uniref:Ubiquitin carboxyl-terminal hydrolase n=1 Tax=Potamilus streckersoni TaxID=2493646 RepID=A0AAE0RSD5_9BIVA|nr:hypothetical protein CHS0354_002964 [Potamilus streckersoni]
MAEGGVPDLETQKKDIDNLLKLSLRKGDIWYLIDNKWFKQWKKYIGYDSWDSQSAGEESANPGPIDNRNMFKENTLVEGQMPKLKEHMIDDIDYILVPEEAWNKLVGWYGLTEGQEPIARKVIQHGLFVRNCKVEVYYLDLKLCENSHPENQILKQFSRTDTIDDVEKEMRRTFNIAEKKEVRLWNRYTTNTYEQLTKPENTLQDAGLYHGQVIVIELKNDDGTWPRQAKSASAYNNSGSLRSGNSYNSSSSFDSGYNGGYSYEGRSSRQGLCGLSNLGNTCFMNSAIQCMSNVPLLTKYFLSKKWMDEINEENPLGMHGEIARSYAELVQIMWSGKSSYTAPRNFKYAVGHFAPQFSGYQQHDCQELMAFLLDGLHEDLNRIRKKPYVEMKDADGRPDQLVASEAWSIYKQRNDSIIVDIFHGLYKSTVHCPECSKISVTFDPFCYLSLPLPVKKERQIDVFWVPLNPLEQPVQFKLTVPKMGSVTDMCSVLAEYVQVEPEYMMVTDVYSFRFHKFFARDESLSHIMDRDDIFIYELPIPSVDDPDQLILPIYLREQRSKSNYQQYQSYQLFGQPLLLTVQRKNCSYNQLYNLVLQRLQRFVRVPPETDRWWIEEKTPTTSKNHVEEEGSKATFANRNGSKNGEGNNSNSAETKTEEEKNNQGEPSTSDTGMEVSNCEDSSNNITDEEKCSDFINGSDQTSENSEDCVRTDNFKPPRLFKFTLVNSYGNADMDYKLNDDGKPLKLNSRSYVAVDWNPVARKRFYNESAAEGFIQHETMKMKPQKKQVIQINDCLELFTTTEKLGQNDPWYCPKCEKHQQATKKFDIWSLPDVLIIHLKRFSYDRYWRDKIDTLVEFPTRGLDMRKYVIGDNSGPLLYDLIAVANHFGGLGGGHYTAYGKNCEDGKWYYFDDSSVSEATDESSVTKAAYVLVYMKQNTSPHLTKQIPVATAPNPETMERQRGDKTEEQMDTD